MPSFTSSNVVQCSTQGQATPPYPRPTFAACSNISVRSVAPSLGIAGVMLAAVSKWAEGRPPVTYRR